MKLEEVLPALREGKRIRRRCYVDGGYILIEEGSMISSSGHCESLDEDDIFADDWEIVPEPKKIQSWLKLYDNGEVFGYESLELCKKSMSLAEHHGKAKLVETRLIEWEASE